MKTRPILISILFAITLICISCTPSEVEKDVKRKVAGVAYISPNGVRHDLWEENGDGQITSGNVGNDTHQEVVGLYFLKEKDTYTIISDRTTFHIPKTYLIEVSER